MKKRIMSMFLVLVMLATVCGCQSANDEVASGKGSTSSASGPEGAAIWLADRLEADHGADFDAKADTVTFEESEVILVSGDSIAEYGVDAGSVDSEGYVIRRVEGSPKTLIMSPTNEGLDRAVRYFANYCPLEGELNITEGEGYRVGSIVIAGKDLSEFVISRPAGSNDPESENYDLSLVYASTELQSYLKKACGVEVSITEEPLAEDEYAISFVKDPTITDGKAGELGIEGFNIKSTDTGITITGGLYSGCLHAVYIFLEDYIGWRFYYELDTNPYASSDDASEYLYEAECVTVPTDIDQTEQPDVGFRCTYGTELHSPKLMYNGWGNWGNPYYGTYGYGDNPCHGIKDNFTIEQREAFGRGLHDDFVMCYTTSEYLDLLCDNIMKELDSLVAGGYVPGKDQAATSVDISHMDHRNFCMCDSCLDIISKYGAVSATEAYGANYVAQFLEEKHPEVLVGMFAYAGTCKPPKNMELHPNVLVSYCFYINDNASTMICGNHGITSKVDGCRSEIFTEQFLAWREMAEYIHVWYYPGTSYYYLSSHPCIYELYDDMQFLAEHEVYGIYELGGPNKSTMMFIHFQLAQRLLWDSSLSREEYMELYREILWLVYGESAGYIYEYFNLLQIAGDRGNSSGCWTNLFSGITLRFDFSYIKENADALVQLYEGARRVAPSETVEMYIDFLFTDMFILVCMATHSSMWLNGDAESKTVYEERLDKFIDLYNNVSRPLGWTACEGNFIDEPENFGYEVNPLDWLSWRKELDGVDYNF